MTTPARRPLSPGPVPVDPSADRPAPLRPAWPLLSAEPAPVDDEDQGVAVEAAAPTGRRPLWTGPRS
ncbi:hypothetical protein [Kitasatospora sp. NPDC056181]|uniref:hypothetical protein n=1 Tax=Kitasatospora sp. NPDC056181 TaxID=3345737 RepID=UPI0035DDC301